MGLIHGGIRKGDIMATQSQIDYLYRQLYNACRSKVDKNFQNDSESVKVCRDSYIAQNYDNRNYRQLSFEELKNAINQLNNGNTSPVITFSQLKLVKFYTIGLGLVYCNLEGLTFTDAEKQPIDWQEARRHYRSQFNNKEKLPKEVLNHLYNEWVNPKCNQWLIEGGFKKYAKNNKILYYEQLSNAAATYLIKRLSQMWAAVSKADAGEHVYDINKN